MPFKGHTELFKTATFKPVIFRGGEILFQVTADQKISR